MKKPELLEQRAAKLAEMRKLQTAADEANRDLSDNERQAFDRIEGEVRTINGQIERAERLENLERAAAATPVGGTGHGEFDREAEGFSLRKAIAHVSGIRVDAGREIEVSDEIARRSGRAPNGIFAPDNVFRVRRDSAEQRVVVSGTTGAGLIFEEARPQDYIDALRSNLVTARLGARALGGLQGNVSIPKNAANRSGQWIAENSALTPVNGDWDKVTMGPKHVGCLTEFSRNLLLQSSPDIETLIRQDFAATLAVAMDRAALVGGGAQEPDGVITLLQAATAMGTLGTPSWSEVLGLIAGVELANAATGRLGWAVNPNAVRTLRSTPKMTLGSPPASDVGGFIMDGPNELAGYAALSTTSLSHTLGSPDPGAAIFGDWSSLLIGYWSGVDILANPYAETPFSKGNVQVRGLLTADVAVRHIESFAAAIDVPAAA